MCHSVEGVGLYSGREVDAGARSVAAVGDARGVLGVTAGIEARSRGVWINGERPRRSARFPSSISRKARTWITMGDPSVASSTLATSFSFGVPDAADVASSQAVEPEAISTWNACAEARTVSTGNDADAGAGALHVSAAISESTCATTPAATCTSPSAAGGVLRRFAAGCACPVCARRQT